MQIVEKRPSRTVLDELVDRFLAAAAKSAAEAARQEARQRIYQAEIEESQKAMTDRLRDKHWSW